MNWSLNNLLQNLQTWHKHSDSINAYLRGIPNFCGITKHHTSSHIVCNQYCFRSSTGGILQCVLPFWEICWERSILCWCWSPSKLTKPEHFGYSCSNRVQARAFEEWLISKCIQQNYYTEMWVSFFFSNTWVDKVYKVWMSLLIRITSLAQSFVAFPSVQSILFAR